MLSCRIAGHWQIVVSRDAVDTCRVNLRYVKYVDISLKCTFIRQHWVKNAQEMRQGLAFSSNIGNFVPNECFAHNFQ